MNYLRCIIAGLIAVILVFLAFPVLALSVVTLALFLTGRFAGIGFDVPRLHVSSLLSLLVVAVFSAGFYWEFRRLSRPRE